MLPEHWCSLGSKQKLVLLQIVPWGSNDAMALVQRKMDVDILITGHTHEFKVCAEVHYAHAYTGRCCSRET